MVHKLIHRVTMFKLPGEEAQKGLLAAYDQLAKDQKKVRPLPCGCRHAARLAKTDLHQLLLYHFGLAMQSCLSNEANQCRAELTNCRFYPSSEELQANRDSLQDGKPYIPFICAGVAMDDPRTKGYTIVAKTEFWSLEDLQYYDKECEAHAALKKTAATLGLAEPPLTVYFEGSPTINFTGTDPNASS